MGGDPAGWPAASTPVSLERGRARACSCARSAGRETGRSASARTARCVIAAVFVLALAVLGSLFVIPGIVRAVRGGATHDPARRLLILAVRGLPPDRFEWGQAMLGELDQARERRSRWRFSLGCAWAAGRIRLQSPEAGGACLRAVILGCAALSLALVGYGLVLYPGLRSEPNVWGAMAVFLALLTYTGLALVLARGVSRQSIAARRFGLGGGLATGAGWLLGIAPPAALKGWVFLPLLIALIAPALATTIAGHRSGNSRTGNLTALWSGLVAGLTVFIVWTTFTYLNAGGPYDSGLVNDFRTSGRHDLPTYAVSDNLGSGLILLLLIPTVALALGTLGTRLLNATRHN